MLAHAAVAAVLLATAYGQVLVQAPCPAVTVVQDLDVARYLGLWQEVERYNLIFERGNCSTATYGPVSDEGVVKVVNQELVNNEPSNIEGTAVLANASSTEGKLIVSFNVSNVETKADYWVLGTDYDNYSLVWSCTDLPLDFSFQSAWILGRTKPLSAEAASTVESLIRANSVNRSHFKTHDQAECATYPKSSLPQ